MEKYILYGAAAAVIFVTLKLFSAPIRWGIKLLLNTLLGLALLVLFNFFGSYIGVTLGLNLVNALAVGIFGPAGLVLLLIIRWLLL
ncbi:MAG: pro-sigmaK processing inhibitor BofA family protein [Clostridia bacterium]|nr:pro-sigmaK processing inhibitor BofA family protein [Clostridia bacterium]